MSEDFNLYPLWENQTTPQRTYEVNNAHPSADDENPGSPEAPLRTIGAAVELAQPGQKILICAGRYRECIKPKRGGHGPDSMITIEASPGEEVIVSGSEPLDIPWTRPRWWDEGYGEQSLTPSGSPLVWVGRVPDELIPEEYDALERLNVESWEEKLMEWMEPVAGNSPFCLKTAMLFQDGRRLTQLNHSGDVSRIPGSFWIDRDHRSLHVRPWGDLLPQELNFELAIRPHLLRPESTGLDFIGLSGLVFEHAANPFLRTSRGAVTTLGGGHWIIENNTFREINSCGLEFGDKAFERHDPHPLNPGKGYMGSGNVIVRANLFHDCGTAGIRCLRVTEGRVIQNHFHHCGWQDGELYFECAAIKLLVTTHTLVEGNRIHDLVGACGIWLDWDNRYSRVTGNVIEKVRAQQGGIFIEASRTPNLIDRNLLWGIDGSAIFGGDSSHQIYAHNLIGETSGPPFLLKCHTDRNLHGEQVTCVKNTVSHNLLVEPEAHELQNPENHFENNVDIRSSEGSTPSDAGAEVLTGHLKFDSGKTLTWRFRGDAQGSHGHHPFVKLDLAQREWIDQDLNAGPLGLSAPVGTLQLP